MRCGRGKALLPGANAQQATPIPQWRLSAPRARVQVVVFTPDSNPPKEYFGATVRWPARLGGARQRRVF